MNKARYRLSAFRGIVAFLFLGLLLCTCSIHTQAASNYKKTYGKILK